MEMQRYFFHYFDGQSLHFDQDGFEFENEADALRAALIAGRTLFENTDSFIRLQRGTSDEFVMVRSDGQGGATVSKDCQDGA